MEDDRVRVNCLGTSSADCRPRLSTDAPWQNALLGFPIMLTRDTPVYGGLGVAEPFELCVQPIGDPHEVVFVGREVATVPRCQYEVVVARGRGLKYVGKSPAVLAAQSSGQVRNFGIDGQWTESIEKSGGWRLVGRIESGQDFGAGDVPGAVLLWRRGRCRHPSPPKTGRTITRIPARRGSAGECCSGSVTRCARPPATC